jgi:hypothetical protein
MLYSTKRPLARARQERKQNVFFARVFPQMTIFEGFLSLAEQFARHILRIFDWCYANVFVPLVLVRSRANVSPVSSHVFSCDRFFATPRHVVAHRLIPSPQQTRLLKSSGSRHANSELNLTKPV